MQRSKRQDIYEKTALEAPPKISDKLNRSQLGQQNGELNLPSNNSIRDGSISQRSKRPHIRTDKYHTPILKG
jgi:hypothetical protein